SCLASSTQQMNSLRAKGVMFCQAVSAVELASSASRRSAGSLCTTPPDTGLPLMAASVIRSTAASVEAAAGFTPSGELHASHEDICQPSSHGHRCGQGFLHRLPRADQ